MFLLLSEEHLLKERVSTILGTLLLGSVALWAGVTIWQTATGTNPVTKAFAAVLTSSLEQDY
ncbi:hypothetical protein KW798_01450 [Candidatus Parcubacteria bacterium]|nr:hypothetical protein [Candidatus Parcubacteria bacterium]